MTSGKKDLDRYLALVKEHWEEIARHIISTQPISKDKDNLAFSTICPIFANIEKMNVPDELKELVRKRNK